MKRGAFVASAAATASLLPLAAGAQYLRQSTIGVSVPLSGTMQNFGAEVVRGVQAAIDETNRYTQLAGRGFGIRSFDDRGSGTQAITNVQIAQADPSMIAMIGNLTADVTLNALPSYANANFAVIVPTVTADALTSRGFRNVFRLATKDSSEGTLIARSELSGKRRLRAIAVAMEGPYGAEVARGFQQQARADKHDADTVTIARDAHAAGAAKTIMDARPQYVFLAGKVGDLGPVAEALRLGGYAGPFACSDGFYSTETTDRYATVLDGALVASSIPPLNRVPSMTVLLRDFQSQVNPITAFSAFGYAAGQLVIAAAQRSGALSRFSLLTSLQRGGSYTTMVGEYQFNFAGDAIIPDVYLYSVSAKGGFTYEKPAFRTGFVV